MEFKKKQGNKEIFDFIKNLSPEESTQKLLNEHVKKTEYHTALSIKSFQMQERNI